MTKRTKWLLGIGFGLIVIVTIFILEFNPYSISSLRKDLYSKDALKRYTAIRLLAETRDEKCITRIRELLNDEDASVRFRAVYFLPGWDKDCIPLIRKLINDNDPEVSLMAIYCLATFNDKESIPELKTLINNNNERMSIASEGALKQLGVSDEEIQKAKEKK